MQKMKEKLCGEGNHFLLFILSPSLHFTDSLLSLFCLSSVCLSPPYPSPFSLSLLSSFFLSSQSSAGAVERATIRMFWAVECTLSHWRRHGASHSYGDGEACCSRLLYLFPSLSHYSFSYFVIPCLFLINPCTSTARHAHRDGSHTRRS